MAEIETTSTVTLDDGLIIELADVEREAAECGRIDATNLALRVQHLAARGAIAVF